MPLSDKPRPKTRRPRRMARAPQNQSELRETSASPSTAPLPTKLRRVLDLLQHPEGCTVARLMEATGWQAHTTRAVLTGLRKKGHHLTSRKPESGARIYRIETGEDRA